MINQASERMKVFSHEELIKEEKNRQRWLLVAAAISGAAESYSASQSGYSNHSGSYSTTINSGNQTYNTSGTYQGRTYDPNQARIASEIAAQKNANRVNAIRYDSALKTSRLDNSVARRNTIFPGQSYTGIVVFDAPRIQSGETRSYTVNIPVGDDVHVIDLSQEL